LHDHSGRLINNKNKLGGIRDELTKGEKKIKKMMMRIRKNKFILFAVLAGIFLVIIIILGIYFGGKSQQGSQ
jgi:hypothetical protein